ncbi:MAG: hypothetical protein P0Y55_13140 [Candidatus Cohnella colombiensis]|uniref:Uncharacterized protein n=1 Tax=Candidatus Cohnella colombiensis TaxID=3121368 RepID=A0AA95EU73_9BACL|nr:MAG: hypothetical protein P0Y55_13140 [Cohnella sp.]
MSEEPKKISLAEAMKQRLAQKKQEQSAGKAQKDQMDTGVKAMKSQIKKRPNNQKKRTGV